MSSNVVGFSCYICYIMKPSKMGKLRQRWDLERYQVQWQSVSPCSKLFWSISNFLSCEPSIFRNQFGGSFKKNAELPCNSAIPFLSIPKRTDNGN
jgi:hypothetical protein